MQPTGAEEHKTYCERFSGVEKAKDTSAIQGYKQYVCTTNRIVWVVPWLLERFQAWEETWKRLIMKHSKFRTKAIWELPACNQIAGLPAWLPALSHRTESYIVEGQIESCSKLNMQKSQKSQNKKMNTSKPDLILKFVIDWFPLRNYLQTLVKDEMDSQILSSLNNKESSFFL